MKTHFVVTGVVKNKDKFLILKKSPDDRNYPNRWSFCSGFIKEFEPAEDACLREAKEETGLDVKITRTGKILEVIDNDKRWVVAVYLCETDKTDVKLCHENVDYKWVTLDEMKDYEFVPGIREDLEKLGFLKK